MTGLLRLLERMSHPERESGDWNPRAVHSALLARWQAGLRHEWGALPLTMAEAATP